MNGGWRDIRAGWRDTIILINEFHTPVILFTITVLIAAFTYAALAEAAGEPVEGYTEAVYIALTSAFFQFNGEFPNSIFLQLFHIFMPIVGISALALGLADFGSLLFNRRARNKEWEMAVASTMKKHTIVVGLGHLGFRIIQKLHGMDRQIVVIELDPATDLISAVQKMKIPIIQADATRPVTLEAANIKSAQTIILASQNDAMNLQIALKARTLNPEIHVVIRIFDEDFAQALREQFGFTALSATEMAAPVFASAAAGADVTNPISIEGQQFSLARFTISPGSKLANRTIGYVEDNFKLNVILLRHNQTSELHPKDTVPLQAGDTLAVLGGPEQLRKLMLNNR
ncbi:MAG TPA: NAD-binding protein [Anaerolineales bacterium]|nr:NAD-binding protein [Anaerolineales bacterium]